MIGKLRLLRVPKNRDQKWKRRPRRCTRERSVGTAPAERNLLAEIADLADKVLILAVELPFG